jgi:hypothetical protein
VVFLVMAHTKERTMIVLTPAMVAVGCAGGAVPVGRLGGVYRYCTARIGGFMRSRVRCAIIP